MKKSRLPMSVILFLVVGCAIVPGIAQERSYSVNGTVKDQTGAVVAGARISAAQAKMAPVVTSQTGEFHLRTDAAGPLTLTIEAPGFRSIQRVVSPGESQIDVALVPAGISQEINVTANRSDVDLSTTAESVTLLSRQDVQTSAAVTTDDVLRQVPGFTLFRRSGSRTANPTSQGVSLRGIGASGASRALVLYNGVPLNDPFGGWIYWGRVPRQDIASIEVLRGGASSLYGSSALSGVVNIIPVSSTHNMFSSEVSMGSERTPDFSAVDSLRFGRWSLNTSGAAFSTNGYVLVPSDRRGTVDVPADSSHQVGEARLSRGVGAGSVFVGGSFYNESRDNGTPLQTNGTQLWEVFGGTDIPTNAGNFQLRGFGNGQSYDQIFTAIAASRNAEFLVDQQHVPAQRLGADLVWSRGLGAFNSIVAGADTSAVRGFSNEVTFASSRPSSHLSTGGDQLLSGAFLQDMAHLGPRLVLTLGGRFDHWDNYDAQTQTVPLTATVKPNFTAFPDQSKDAFSPRGALLVRANNHLNFTASAYKSFRAPTLNELYRGFRVGNTLTLANSQLVAERLSGAEAGTNLFLGRTRFHATYFLMQVSDPIANVTLNTTPALITNQRQNLGRTLSQGVEGDFDWQLRRLDLAAGYQFVNAVVRRFPANPALVGQDVPQVAPHQFTFRGLYNIPGGWFFALQGRAASQQFEDDLNTLPLDGFFQMDGYLSKRIGPKLDVFAAVENMLNSRAVVGRTPVPTLGPPILARVGFKVHFE